MTNSTDIPQPGCGWWRIIANDGTIITLQHETVTVAVKDIWRNWRHHTPAIRSKGRPEESLTYRTSMRVGAIWWAELASGRGITPSSILL